MVRGRDRPPVTLSREPGSSSSSSSGKESGSDIRFSRLPPTACKVSSPCSQRPFSFSSSGFFTAADACNPRFNGRTGRLRSSSLQWISMDFTSSESKENTGSEACDCLACDVLLVSLLVWPVFFCGQIPQRSRRVLDTEMSRNWTLLLSRGRSRRPACKLPTRASSCPEAPGFLSVMLPVLICGDGPSRSNMTPWRSSATPVLSRTAFAICSRVKDRSSGTRPNKIVTINKTMVASTHFRICLSLPANFPALVPGVLRPGVAGLLLDPF